MKKNIIIKCGLILIIWLNSNYSTIFVNVIIIVFFETYNVYFISLGVDTIIIYVKISLNVTLPFAD